MADDDEVEFEPTVQQPIEEMQERARDSVRPEVQLPRPSNPRATVLGLAPPAPNPRLTVPGVPPPAGMSASRVPAVQTEPLVRPLDDTTKTGVGVPATMASPLAVPANVEIREMTEPEEEDTVVSNTSPFAQKLAAKAKEKVPDSAPETLTREPDLPDTAVHRAPVFTLPELDADDDGKDGDAYEADESVTMRGPSRDLPGGSGTHPTYDDPDDETADDAESVTASAGNQQLRSKAKAIGIASVDEPTPDDLPTTTAVMSNPPRGPMPTPATEPFAPPLPAGNSSLSNQAAWVVPAQRRPIDSDSGLRMEIPDQSSVDRVSVDALLPGAVRGPIPTPGGGVPLATDLFGNPIPIRPSGQFDPAVGSMPFPSQYGQAAPKRPSYAVLVAAAVGVAVLVPVVLFVVLRQDADPAAPRTPSVVVPDPVRLDGPRRERAPKPPPPPPAASSPPKVPWWKKKGR